MSDITPDYPDTPGQQPPTQVSFPVQAIIRTIVQAAVGYLIALLISLMPGAEDLLRQLSPYLVDALTAAVITGGAALMAFIMTRPGVNDFLTKIHLGATPKAPPGLPKHGISEV